MNISKALFNFVLITLTAICCFSCKDSFEEPEPLDHINIPDYEGWVYSGLSKYDEWGGYSEDFSVSYNYIETFWYAPDEFYDIFIKINQAELGFNFENNFLKINKYGYYSGEYKINSFGKLESLNYSFQDAGGGNTYSFSTTKNDTVFFSYNKKGYLTNLQYHHLEIRHNDSYQIAELDSLVNNLNINTKLIWKDNDLIEIIREKQYNSTNFSILDSKIVSQTTYLDENVITNYQISYDTSKKNESQQFPYSISQIIMYDDLIDMFPNVGMTGYGPSHLPTEIKIIEDGTDTQINEIKLSQIDLDGIKVISIEKYAGQSYKYNYSYIEK